MDAQVNAVQSDAVRKCARRLQSLRRERQSWEDHWQDLADYLQPRRSRFLDKGDRTNWGSKKNDKIINSTAPDALDTLASGMQGGLTSPSRPWFKLGLSDQAAAEYGPVKAWLHLAQRGLLTVLGRSNFYDAIHTLYLELGAFGTGVLFVEEDDETLVRFRTLTIGEYFLANGMNGRVNAIFRQFRMTALQLVERFGKDAVSQATRSKVEAQAGDEWVDVVHCVYPREGYDPESMNPKRRRFASVYYEGGPGGEGGHLLEESGFYEFPAMCPRWSVTGSDVYGYSPGMHVLGDAKMLQAMETKALKALDKQIDPPLAAPSSMAAAGISLIPGDVNYVDAAQGEALKPIINVNLNVQQVEYKIEKIQQRIERGLKNDLFRMLDALGAQGRQITATEITERQQEKLQQLGPVLERLQNELLDPLIDRVFAILDRRGFFPRPPDELFDQDLKVEYVSMLAQAQKMTGVTALQQVSSFIGQVAQTQAALAQQPDALDNLDTDALCTEYADMVGTPPAVLRNKERVRTLRQARAEQQRQAAQAEQLERAVGMGKTLSETTIGQNSAMDELLKGITQ